MSLAEEWAALGGAIAIAREELIAAAPDAVTAAEGEAYLMRLVAAGLSDGFLGHLRWSDGLGQALPTKGGPNPDYLMYHAGIDAARSYRLEGRLNASERVGIGLYKVDSAGVALPAGYAAFDAGTVGEGGSFALDIAADAAGPSTLAIPPGSRVLLVRVLHRSAQGQPCTLKLSGGADARGLSPSMGSAERTLKMSAPALLRGVRQFLRWSQVCGAMPNRFSAPPPEMAEEVQGDPDTFYGLGYYDLAPGERLEVLIPEGIPGYWSLHAYNHWCEALPGAGIGDQSAVPDADGRTRVRIGPGLATDLLNRVDTQGRLRGVLIYRVIGMAGASIPETLLRR